MPAKIYCIRHAQGLHNLGPQNYHLVDPALTTLGLEQCATLSACLHSQFGVDKTKISLITASPLTRTLHTAYLTFRDILDNPTKSSLHQYTILAIPDIQETSTFRNDTGSELDVLKKICSERNWPVDLSLVHDGWTNKSFDRNNRYLATDTAIKARARDARNFLRSKAVELEKEGVKDPEIVVVSHGGFLHYFTDDWEDAYNTSGTAWHNTEIRSYAFQDDMDDANAYIAETAESRTRRGKTGKRYPAGGSQQHEWFDLTMKTWEQDGMQTGPSVEREMRQGPHAPQHGGVEDGSNHVLQRQTSRGVEGDESKGGSVKISA